MANRCAALQDLVELEAWFLAANFAEALQNLLNLNAGVTKLALQQVNLSNDQMAQLADALAMNFRVRCLALRDCNIADVGAISLAQALKPNKVLQSLSLEGNQIGDAGACALMEAIANNESMTSLSLGRNSIGEDDCTWLPKHLTENYTLCLLDLTHNMGPGLAAVRDPVRALLRRNKRPSRVVTLYAETGPDGLSISCLGLAGTELARFDVLDTCLSFRELRSALALQLCEPMAKLALVLPCGSYLTTDDDKRQVVDIVGA